MVNTHFKNAIKSALISAVNKVVLWITELELSAKEDADNCDCDKFDVLVIDMLSIGTNGKKLNTSFSGTS